MGYLISETTREEREQMDKVLLMINQGTYVDIQDMKAKTIPLVEDEYGFRVRGY